MNDLRNAENRMLCVSFKNTYTETVSRPTGSWKLEAGSRKSVGGWRASAGRISHTILIQFSHHNIVKYLYGPSARRSCEGTGSFFECCLRQMPRRIQHAHRKNRITWKSFQKLHFLYGIEIPLVFIEFSNFSEFSYISHSILRGSFFFLIHFS